MPICRGQESYFGAVDGVVVACFSCENPKIHRDLQSAEVDLKQQMSLAPRYFVGTGVYNASGYPIRQLVCSSSLACGKALRLVVCLLSSADPQ